MDIIHMSPSSLFSSSFLLRLSAIFSAVIFKLFFASVSFMLAVVGTSLGATAGAMVGQRTKSGFVHGAVIGANMGYVLAAEILKVSFDLCDPDNCAAECFIPLVETALKLLNERLVREGLSPTMQVLAQNQADAVHIAQNEIPRIYRESLSINSRRKIPMTRLSDKNIVDTLWNGPTCSICFQDFQLGEIICSLPQCHHTYHPHCIGKWFRRRRSCPLCRLNLRDAQK